MKKGFTLLELTLVLGILSALLTILVIILNPTEWLREARDARRLSDAAMLKQSIDLYLVRASNPQFDVTACDINHKWRASVQNLTGIQKPFTNPYFNPLLYENLNTTGTFQFPSDSVNAFPYASSEIIRKTDGSGWISIPFSNLGTDAAMSALPVDPLNVSGLLPVPESFKNVSLAAFGGGNGLEGFYYAFQCNGLTYEINMNMESFRYGNPGSPQDVENQDGGTSACYNGFCDPIENNQNFITTNANTFFGGMRGCNSSNNFCNVIRCAGPNTGTPQAPNGSLSCQYCESAPAPYGLLNPPLNPPQPALCPIVQSGAFSATFLADSVYEVGNDVGLDL